MIRPEVLDALLEAGASAEAIVAAVKAAALVEEAQRGVRRARDAERQRRVRATYAAAAESRGSVRTLPPMKYLTPLLLPDPLTRI